MLRPKHLHLSVSTALFFAPISPLRSNLKRSCAFSTVPAPPVSCSFLVRLNFQPLTLNFFFRWHRIVLPLLRVSPDTARGLSTLSCPPSCPQYKQRADPAVAFSPPSPRPFPLPAPVRPPPRLGAPPPRPPPPPPFPRPHPLTPLPPPGPG